MTNPRLWSERTVRVGLGILVVLSAFALVFGVRFTIAHTATVADEVRDSEILRFSKDSVAQLVSTERSHPDEYIDRVLADAAGDWWTEFDARKDAVAQSMAETAGDSVGTSLAAGIEHRDDSGTVTVLVAAAGDRSASATPDSATPDSVTPDSATAAPSGDPIVYQFRVDVVDVDGQLKLAKVGFVQ